MRAPNSTETVEDVFLVNFVEAQGTPKAGWGCYLKGNMFELSQPGPHKGPREAIQAYMSSLHGT